MSTEAFYVRDAIMDRLEAKSFFTGFHTTTNKSVQIQPQSIPFLGVYLIEETSLPDGDPNVGEVRFRSYARFGMSVIVQNNDAVAAETKLDQAMMAINELFKDPTLYNWSGDYGDHMVQAYTRGARSHVFGSIGQDNEIPIAELRYDLTCDLGTIYYPPDTPDDLHLVYVKTQFPSGGTAAEIASTQQVEAEFYLWQLPPANLTVYRPSLGKPTLEIPT